MTPALEARGLCKSFSGIMAAQDVSISIPPGAVVGLIGANGAGKTTFVNLATGHLTPDAGTIAADGRDITGLRPRQIRHLGVSRSFQIPQLFLELTVATNLVLAERIARSGRGAWLHPFRVAEDPATSALVDAVLARFNIEAYRDAPARDVPGGIRKLLDVAMATLDHPRVLLLDEPTSGVAAKEKYAFMDLVMSALALERAAVLFIEHDMDIVRRYADRIIVFHEGRVMADGAPDATLAQPDVRRLVTGAGA